MQTYLAAWLPIVAALSDFDVVASTSHVLAQSGGGGGHSLTWGYEHRGQMAFLSEMWSLEKAAGVWERGRCVKIVVDPRSACEFFWCMQRLRTLGMYALRSKNADANSLEGGGSLDSVGKVEKILEWCDAHLEEGSFFKD